MSPLLLAVGVWLAHAWFMGWLPIPIADSYSLRILFRGESSEGVGTAYEADADDPSDYRAFDQRYLWRVTISPAALRRLVRANDPQPADEAPDYFWKQAPYWWPNRAPEDASFFVSDGWRPDARGGSGYQFLMMHDPGRGAAYFFVKLNY